MTTPDTNWLMLARDAFTASTSYFDVSIRSQIEADLRQAQGKHPQGSKYLANSGRSKLFRPKTRAVIRKNEAVAAEAFFATRDVVQITAEDDNDPRQQASAAVMAELLQYRLTKSIPWFLTLVGAYQDAQTVGIVASYQYWDYNERKKTDKPAVRLIPVENLRFDPAASWTDPVNTSPYLIELVPMYLGEVRSRMATPDPKTGEAKWKQLSDAQIMAATTGYGDTIRQQREGQRMDSKSQQQANNAFTVVWVHKNLVMVDDIDYVYYTLGTEHLLSDPVPLEQKYLHGIRPYVVGSCIIETHKTYQPSVPALTHDIQAEINEVANARIDNVKLALNKRYFARRNKQVDIRSVTKNVPGSVTLMNDVDDVKVVEFNDVTGSSYKEQEVLNLDFDDMAGSFSGSSVQSNRKLNETVGGMKLLDSNASQVSAYQLRTFVETWVEPVLKQLVLLEQFYETDETVLALCGQRAKLMQKFGIDAVTDDMLVQELTLNVNVGMGATNPTEQMKLFVSGMTALRDMLADGILQKQGLVVEEVIKELFGKLGYRDGKRFFDSGEQDPQLAQMQQTIEQLQQALDAKMPPELLAATVRKIEAEIASMGVKDKVQNANAVKQGTEAQFSAMQTAEVIAAVPAVAPIADELMRAAGYVVPNPPGVDPNFPQPGMADPNVGIKDVANKRTGMVFTPGDASAASTTVNPLPPTPPTAGVGERHGIETLRPDSAGSAIAQAAMADGGVVGSYGYNKDGSRKSDYGYSPSTPLYADESGRPMARGYRDAPDPMANPDNPSLPTYPFVDTRPASPNPPPTLYVNSLTDYLMSHGLTDRLIKRSGFLADGGMVHGYADGGTVRGSIGVHPVDDALALYDQWSQQHPNAKLAADVLPGSNVASSAMDVASDLNKGEYMTAAGDALGLIPGFKLAKSVLPPSAIARAAAGLSKNRQLLDLGVNALPEWGNKVFPQPVPGYAEGGLIAGPGTGTSDSIPAQAGATPMAVSAGEYRIPAQVVQALGQDFFEKIVAQFHTPAGGQPGAMPPGAPLPLENGDFIVPADCVEALGADFFDKLVELYGAAQ